MSLTDKEYRLWLTSAYRYYYGTKESEMTDYEWDIMGKRIIPEEHIELKGTNYEPGQSLFWLPKNKYPDWAKE
jgi:hypothetical protein